MKPSLLSLALVSTLISALAGAACAYGVPISDGAPDAKPESRGRDLVARCAACHGSDLGGGPSPPAAAASVVAPNLTPDRATGLGAWDDATIARAVREGVGPDGMALCTEMPRYAALDDAGVSSLVQALRELPPVARATPRGACRESPTPPTDAQDDPCAGLVAPESRGPCDACPRGLLCAPNGCRGAMWCEVATRTCVPRPYGC